MTTEIKRATPTALERAGLAAHSNLLSEAISVASAMVAHRGGKKIRTLVWSIAAARAALAMAVNRKEARRESGNSSVTLTSTDPLYGALQRWIASNIDQTANNSFAATFNVKQGVVYSQSGKGKLVVVHNGSLIYIESGDQKPSPVGGGSGDPFDEEETSGMASSLKSLLPQKITLSCADMSPIRSFIQTVVEHLAATEKKSRLFTSNRWGSWNSISDVPPRDINSVILAGHTRENLVGDIKQFLSHEQRYVQLGIPYHRGYLLWGPAGTGKTSTARALATHFNIDIYHIALSTVEDDGRLMELMNHIKPRSILLIEDIDVAGAQVAQRDESDDSPATQVKGVTLSGLLNALDGLSTPHGLITVMTSNFPQNLDSALTRRGRIDMQFHIDLADRDQTIRLVRQFTGVELDPDAVPYKLAPSDVVEMVKGTFDMNDPIEIRDHIYLCLYDASYEASSPLPPPTAGSAT